MSELMIQLAEDRKAFVPGEEITGQVSWRLEQPAERMELRLYWHTRGKGTTDTQTVQTLPFDKPMLQEQRMFKLTAPQGPYSFSGVLISLVWVLELVAYPSGAKAQSEIVLSPNGQEIQLPVVKS
jgi:hypothetical protein